MYFFCYVSFGVVRQRAACLVFVSVAGCSLRCSLIPACFSPGVILDESKALSLLAPANAVAGILPGGGLLPTPNPLVSEPDLITHLTASCGLGV